MMIYDALTKVLQAARSKQRPSVSKVKGSNVTCLAVGSPPDAPWGVGRFTVPGATAC